jgi:hypothetical protein
MFRFEIFDTNIGKETRTITRLFKNTDIRIAYKRKNTIQSHLQPKRHITDKYNSSCIYKIKCNSCQLKYIGQTSRNVRTRYKEHIHAIHTNKTTSKYAQHILDTQYAYGTIENTLDILHIEKKGPLERFHIYKLSQENMQPNDTYTDIHNPIFNLITKYYKEYHTNPNPPVQPPLFQT